MARVGDPESLHLGTRHMHLMGQEMCVESVVGYRTGHLSMLEIEDQVRSGSQVIVDWAIDDLLVFYSNPGD